MMKRGISVMVSLLSSEMINGASVNKKGKEVVPCKYDEVGTFFGGFAKVKLNGKWGKVNTRGEEFCD